MGRPQIYLKDWCLEDSLLKAEFLKKESENPRGLVVITSHQGYIPNINIYPHFQSGNFDRGRLNNGLSIQVTPSCYEKLKAKFRTFKKNDNDKNKVKKQYHFEKELSARIQYLKNENGWAKEEIVIEHVINAYTNSMAYNKSKAKVDTKIIKLQILNEEINKNLLEIQQLKTEVFELKQKLLKESSAKEHYENLCKEHGIDGENFQLTETSPS
ncbi:hypothetical protein C3F34_11505 [Acinetobacter sp. ACNIH2]|uniref:hypothetical protein n=1 Tax=Acinetobacter sp. ACNIH2 TaxID=1758189 RepID=UPI000CDC151B|nr:hypothetical protein [Acinetobacter sp. ACNIH2]AUX86601.1 hypothetical protein C3F34_11505 [Acinetobacter sp. ACNIH2]